MDEQEFNLIRQQLREEIARNSSVNEFERQTIIQADSQALTHVGSQVNISARQFLWNSISNFSTSLPNLNTDSLMQISSTRNSQQPWTTDDLIEAERFYHRVDPIDIEPNLLSPDSHGRNAPLPRRDIFYFSESSESSPINRQVSQDIFLTNPNPDLTQRIDLGGNVVTHENVETLSSAVSFFEGEERESRLSPDSDQSTRSNESLRFPETNSPTNFSTRFRLEQTPFASPAPSPASSSTSSPRNSSPINSL
jgi:hypothetical protein